MGSENGRRALTIKPFAKLERYTVNAFRRWQCGGLRAIAAAAVAKLHAYLETPEQNAVESNLLFSVWAVMRWIEQATLERTPLVSVILPTHNRSALLRRAIESVCGQVYTNWEIVLVDDGSVDDTPIVVQQLQQKLGENRLQAFRISPSGVSAARNYALGQARGEFITYLDDDNIMHSLWLKSVVWSFSQRPEVDVIYGGMISEDMRHINSRGGSHFPSYFLCPFDRQHLVESNLADMGQIAHRRGLPEAHFDESLRTMVDWDLLLRLASEKPPLVIPTIACFYFTRAEDRLSANPPRLSDVARIREKARRLFG